MNLPVRVRLVLWYVALFAIVVGIWSVFVIVRIRADLYSSVDHGLAARATQLASTLTQGSKAAFKDLSSATLAGVAPQETVAQLLSPTGNVVAHSGDAAAAKPIVSAQLLRNVALLGRAQVETVADAGEQFRVLVVQLPKSQRFLLVGQSTESVDSAVQRLGLVMLLSGPLALLAAAIAGWFLARRALRPVARMTTTAANVGIDRLDERVPVPGAEDELRSLAETLNGMLERLETGVRDKRRLVANASHELQTPLAVMRTELDVYLSSSELADDTREVLESVREEVDRMSRIVRNLLTLARFDDGNLTLLREPFDLHDLAEETVESLETLARERQVNVGVDGESTPALVDKEYLRLVAANLLENAIRYSGTGSEVRIFTKAEGGEAVLSVADTGQGIAPVAAGHIFDRFYRAEDKRAEESGSGLGLAITKEIVECHGGVVELETQPGVGSRFTVHLPQHLDAIEAVAADERRALDKEATVTVESASGEASAPGVIASPESASDAGEPREDDTVHS